MFRATRLLFQTALLATLSLGGLTNALAADPVRGKALFNATNGAPLNCASSGCHAGFPTSRPNNIQAGTSANVILNAISNNKGGMGILAGYVNSTDAADIAAYIANPSAANGSPAISLTATTLTFAAQTVGTSSAPQMVTVSNSGSASLTISGLTLAGTASADYTRAGTCSVGGSVAAGASCTIQVTFTPTAAGTRSATLTIAHNATGGTSTITLNGTAQASAAAASASPMALSFTQTAGTTSAAQTVTISNTGGSPLTINTIAFAGASVAEYALATGGTCAVGMGVNGGASCTVRVAFTPIAVGARPASLSISHTASATPLTVALNGSGVAAPMAAVSLSTGSLDFGAQAVGSASPAQTVTLINSGQAALTISALTLAGAAAGDFTRSGTCAAGASVAAGATCTLQMAFTPSAIGARAATLTVASNAANGTAVVSLAGTGIQPVLAINPTAAALQGTVGSLSAAVQAVISNAGQSALTVSAITVDAPFVLTTGANACAVAPLTLSPGQSCNLFVAFQPAAEGSASGAVSIASNASSTPAKVMLTASAAAPSTAGNAAGAPTSTNIGMGGCSIGAPEQLFDPVLAAMLSAAVFEILRRRRRVRATSR